MASPITRHLHHHDGWRALSTINAFRCLIAFGLVGTQLSPVMQNMLFVTRPLIFDTASLSYLGFSGLAIVCTVLRRPSMQAQVTLFSTCDIAALACIMLASAGVNTGLGFLLCVFAGCAATLLNTGNSIALAVLAALAIMLQEALHPIIAPGAESELFRAGVLGLLIVFVTGLAQLMAQRVRAHEAVAEAHAGTLRNLTELNQRIIEQMDVGAIVVDGRQHVQLANAAATRMLRTAAPPAADTPLAGLSPTVADTLDGWLRSPGAPTAAIEVNGHTLLPTFSVLPVFSGRRAEANMPVLIFLEDAERQSEQAHNLKLAALGRLSAGIAHEIRNPLSAITQATQLLAESEELTAADHKLLDIVGRHSHRIDAIVGDVMGLSRRNTGSQPPLLLRDNLERVVTEYEQQSDDPAAVSIDDVDTHQWVRFDPDHLHRIVLNLCRNAERYARLPDKALHIRLLGSGGANGTYCLDVMDNGPGIDDITIRRILEPFYTTGSKGVGLGLHVARELCESNGAQLKPIAHTGGACFRIVFSIPGGYSQQHAGRQRAGSRTDRR